VEQLDKLKFVPIYTRSDGDASPGLRALQRKGAKEWLDPKTPDEFKEVLAGNYQSLSVRDTQPTFPLLEGGREAANDEGIRVVTAPPGLLLGDSRSNAATTPLPPAEHLFAEVEKLIDSLGSPLKESDVADHLLLEKKQAGVWLKRLVDEGKYIRKGRPVRYVRTNRIL
jgi:hypothetical protein